MPTESAQNIEEVQDQPLLDEILARRNKLGVPKFYLQYSYRKDGFHSEGDTTNYGRPLYDALSAQPVDPKRVGAMIAVCDNAGSPILDFEVYKEEFGVDAHGNKNKKNIIIALLHAKVESHLKVRWLQQILNLKTVIGEVVINITSAKLLGPLLKEALLFDTEYLKILLEESKKQALTIKRYNALKEIGAIIKNGDFSALKEILEDKDEKDVPYAFGYYTRPESNPGGPLGDALSALPPNREVIQALLAAYDNEGNLLCAGSIQSRSPDVPLVIQAAQLKNLEYLALLLEAKNLDGEPAFDINEPFEGHTVLDIVNKSINPEKRRYANFIENLGGAHYDTLKELYLSHSQYLSKKIENAVNDWEVTIEKSKLLKKASIEIQKITVAYPLNMARKSAINYLAKEIETIISIKKYTVNEMFIEASQVLKEFKDLDKIIQSHKPDDQLNT